MCSLVAVRTIARFLWTKQPLLSQTRQKVVDIPFHDFVGYMEFSADGACKRREVMPLVKEFNDPNSHGVQVEEHAVG